jgi:hypothetical protein
MSFPTTEVPFVFGTVFLDGKCLRVGLHHRGYALLSHYEDKFQSAYLHDFPCASLHAVPPLETS